jgi:CRP-like cAMP-binding protein
MEGPMELNHSRNLLLRQLTPAERKRLQQHFEEQSLAFKETLFEQGEPVRAVYFPENGVVSVVTALENGNPVETGTVGNEGMVGLSALLGVAHSPARVFCQIPGYGLRLPAEVIAEERQRATPWFQLLLRYTHFVYAMTAQGAACNRMHAVDARMSRWLLMTHDRVDADDFPLTQDFLAQMLGVARPTVNTAGAMLQKAGFIKYTRGRITVLNREGLESAACECYARIRQEFEDSLNGRRSVRPRSRRRAG